MYSDTGDTTSLAPGFPIRTSSDPRSVDSSPRHNAASHVLHRLPVPRHPPCALKHLQTQNQKLYKTLKLHIHTHQHPPHKGERSCVLDARNHYPQIKHHTPPPKRGDNTAPPGEGRHLRFPTHRGEEIAGLLSQSPIVCLMISRRPSTELDPRRAGHVCCAPDPHPLQTRGHPSNRLSHRTPTRCGRAQVSWCSLERR
jgi:hypothetical protein